MELKENIKYPQITKTRDVALKENDLHLTKQTNGTKKNFKYPQITKTRKVLP